MLKSQKVTSAMACAGNRRKHTKKMYEVKGLDWDVGAIGNTTYRGVLIRDLLLNSGFSEEDLQNLKGKHLIATGIDCDF
jgi:sulfite oxidase